jgi:outer membrane protein TolC
VARLERRIALLQYQQQLMKTGSDALGVYWQLYRAIEVQQIRQLALDYAHRVENDTKARIDAGKLASSNSIETRAAVLLREVEQLRAEQGVREAESRLATVLNVANLSGTKFGLKVFANAADFAKLDFGTAEQRYQWALDRWPALGIARLRYEQAGLRLAYAKNQSLPTLDLVLSRSNTGLAQDNRTARELAEQGRYPGWSVGLNLEIPLVGNGRASSQYRAQGARVHQSEIEIESIRNALANDVRSHWEQALGGQQEVTRMKGDVELRAELLRIEQVRYDSGLGQLSQLLQRESDLTESRQRLVESNTRLGQANDALLASDGSLLDHYDIYLKD